MKEEITISTGTIIKFILIILALFFLYLVRDVLGIIFTAWVFASALDPAVDKMQRFKIPRALSILIIYLLLILVLSLVIFLFVPPIVNEIRSIAASFPLYYSKMMGFIGGEQYDLTNNIQSALENLSSSLGKLSSGIFSAISGIAGGIVWVIGILVITFYMTVEEEGMKRFIQSLAPLKYQPYLLQKINHIQLKLGSWLWGQLLLMLIIGGLTFIGLKILGIKYALVLALVAGLFEFVPIIGPIISAIPALFFAASGGWVQVVLVLVLYVVIQQMENQIIVPKLMQKAVGLNPIIILVALLVGAKIAGILGMILSIPAVTILSIFLEDFFTEKKVQESKLER